MDQQNESNCIKVLTHKDAFQYRSICCCAVLASFCYSELSEEEGYHHIADCHPNTKKRHGELVRDLGLVPIWAIFVAVVIKRFGISRQVCMQLLAKTVLISKLLIGWQNIISSSQTHIIWTFFAIWPHQILPFSLNFLKLLMHEKAHSKNDCHDDHRLQVISNLREDSYAKVFPNDDVRINALPALWYRNPK